MKRSILRILFFYFIVQTCAAQSDNFSGQVSDKEDSSPLIGASIILLHPADSSIYKGTTVDVNGAFAMNIPDKGKYILKISYVGYSDRFQNVEITDQPLVLGTISVSRSSKTLKSVEVEDKAPTAVQKGDTTQYNANSYKTNPDANAEDLITKMSGITTTDGKVQAHGEDVKKVLVDGKPFFGDDPNAVLKNLPADVIDKIQVFDQLSDQAKFTGFNDGNTTKTINIITKPGMKNGTFGRLFAGYGYDNVYKSGATVNFFNGDRRFTIMAQSNNINEQNFSAEDLAGVMSSSGGGGNRGGRPGMGGPGGGSYRGYGDNNSSNFLVNTKNGIATTHAFGINYTDKWNKKTEISASYFLNSADNNADQSSKRQYVLPNDSGQVYNETNLSRSLNVNHRANVKLEWKPDTMNSFTLKPRFSLQQNDGKSLIAGQTMIGDTMLNSTDNDYRSNVQAYNINTELEYQHKFRKPGRTFAITINGAYNATDASSELYAANLFYSDTSSVPSTLDQQSELIKEGKSVGANINYTEPLFNAKNMIQFSYVNSFNFTENDKRTYNFNTINNDYSDQDTVLSNVFKSDYTSHKAGISYKFNGSKANLNIGVNYQMATLVADQSFPYLFQMKKTFENFLPNAMLRYNFSSKKNLRLHYRTQTVQPSNDQLQNVLNNTNPLQLSIGNADLKQNYEQTLFIRYSGTNTDKASSFFVMLAGTYTLDYITNSTFTASNDTVLDGIALTRGAQLIKPVNMDGYINLRSFLTYGFPISKIKTNLNVNANAIFTRTPGLINNEINTSDAMNYGLGLTFSSNISKQVDFTLSSNSSYNITENSLNKNLNATYLNQTSKFRFNVILLKQLVVNTDLTHQYYTGLSDGFNQNFLLWNAALGYKFLKDQQAEIRFSVNDILKQNTSVTRNSTETYIEDVQNTALQQYYMLTFTYNIKVFKQKAPEDK